MRKKFLALIIPLVFIIFLLTACSVDFSKNFINIKPTTPVQNWDYQESDNLVETLTVLENKINSDDIEKIIDTSGVELSSTSIEQSLIEIETELNNTDTLDEIK
jgi:hypothetical protein